MVSPEAGDWYEAVRRIGWIAPPCPKCPCDIEICKYRREEARFCRVAHLKMRKIWYSGKALLKNFTQHMPSLEQAALWAGVQAQRALVRCQSIKNGAEDPEIKKLLGAEHEAYKYYREAWRECGLSGYKGIGDKQEFDTAVYESK